MSNDTNNNTKNETREITMVEMLQGFLKTHDSVKSEFIHPQTGNPVVAYEQVPRGLEMLGHENWTDMEYLAKMLGLCVGTNVRTTRTGTQIRDLYFSKVQGGPKPGGGNYAWLKFGQLFTKEKQDAETGEIKVISWVQVGLKPYRQVQSLGEVLQAQEMPQELRDDASDAKETKDTVDNL